MTTDAELAALVGRSPDERLLGDQLSRLPESVGRPAPVPPSTVRSALVGAGATLTGVALIGGGLLAAIGVTQLLASGVEAGALLVLALGLLLAGTHWGWVHVAEATADSIEHRRNAGVVAERTDWLRRIEPYTRWEVSTQVQDDGSIRILRVRCQPLAVGEAQFTFEREVELRELHSGDEPGAAVTERAELIRRRAAADTERERARFQIAVDAYRAAVSDREDEQERVAALRAASQALSERINTNLRDPPLEE